MGIAIVILVIAIIGFIVTVTSSNSPTIPREQAAAELAKGDEKLKERLLGADRSEWLDIVFKEREELLKLQETELYSKYGSPSKILELLMHGTINDRVYVFEETSTILIKGVPYNFSEILDFELTDENRIIYTNSRSTTKTATGSMIGRAVVGGALLGGVGAVIGGATAKRDTETYGESFERHDYTIHIMLDNLSNPRLNIHIELAYPEELVRDFVSVLTIICNRNNQSINLK